MTRYILHLLKEGIEELRVEQYNESKNPIAKGLTAFIEAEMTKEKSLEKTVFYEIYVGDKVFNLTEGQSPKGIRDGEVRPDFIRIETACNFTPVDLANHIKYLNQILDALTIPKNSVN